MMDLRSATKCAFEEKGDELLRRPEELRSYLMDLSDPDGVEVRVLMRCCDEGMLASLAGLGATEDGEDVKVAEARMATYLRDVYVVDVSAAKLVAQGVVAGYADWKGVGIGFAKEKVPVGRTPLPEELGGTKDGARTDAAVETGKPYGTVDPRSEPSSAPFVGAARRSGAVDGLSYTLDTNSMHVANVSAVVHLHNAGAKTVNVTVTARSERGKHPKMICRNIEAGNDAIIVFPAAIEGVDSVEVERSNGCSPARRFTKGCGVTPLLVKNVTNAPAKIRRVEVMDDFTKALVYSSPLKETLAAGCSMSITVQLPKGRSCSVYVNGVRVGKRIDIPEPDAAGEKRNIITTLQGVRFLQIALRQSEQGRTGLQNPVDNASEGNEPLKDVYLVVMYFFVIVCMLIAILTRCGAH